MMMNAQNVQADASTRVPEMKDATIFKIPIGKLGLFGNLLFGAVCGFLIFFVTFFLSIIGVTIYDSATGTSMLNLTICYRYIAAPVGILAMFVCITYLLSVWARQKFTRAN